MSVILVTGAATGIGNLAAKALAADGHTVYASMRDPAGRNAAHADDLRNLAAADSVDLRVVELDVQSHASVNQAVATILEDAAQVDVVVHNAGHLYVGYVEAFTAEDIARLFDINVLGAQRVNRAALPHMRERRTGTLVYVGSTTTVSVPPFLGPYVASKFAFDALAMATSYEVSQFGIETSIVMPGAFTHGTEHFPNASHATDQAVTAAYSMLDPLAARNEEATASLFDPAIDADPGAVATEISRILSLPVGKKPFRSVVDFTQSNVEQVIAVTEQSRRDFVTRMGFGELLEVKPGAAIRA
jgi:NAD(P)-dependent dehydrogenase (short-subunit alcohol dehydrogenase family)